MSSRQRLFGSVIAIAAATALVLSGCSGGTAPAPTDAAGDPVSGGTLRVGMPLEAASMDPVRVVSPSAGAERAQAIFDTLMLTVDGEVVPQLAESLEANDDDTVWTLTLREGVNFTDGTPLDADAVVYNIERALDPESPFAFKALMEALTDMEVTGDLTVEFTFSRPFGQFPVVLSDQSSFGYIASPTALEADPEGFGRNPVGAGPFMMDEWIVDQSMTLVRNPDYFQEGLPYLDEIVFEIIPDPSTKLQALQSGDLDFANFILPFDYAPIKDDPQFYASQGIYTGGHSLIWNQNSGPGSDPRLREASALAFDASETAAALTGDPTFFTAEELDCVPFRVGRPECVAGDLPEQDLDRARELVEEYVADGGSRDIQLMGFPTELTLDYVQQTLNNIGLNVTIDRPAASEAVGRYVRGEYEAAVYVIGTTPYFSRTFSALHTGGQGRLQTDELDPFLEVMRDSSDPEELIEAHHGFQESIAESHILIWFAPLINQFVAKSTVHLGTAASTDLVDWSRTWKAADE